MTFFSTKYYLKRDKTNMPEAVKRVENGHLLISLTVLESMLWKLYD